MALSVRLHHRGADVVRSGGTAADKAIVWFWLK